MYASVHERVKSAFRLEDAHRAYKRAVAHRHGTWDDIAKRSVNIRENKIPYGKMPNFDDYTGRLYKENLIFKHIKWLVSMLTGNLVVYDLESSVAIRDENTEALEVTLNMYAAQLDIHSKTSEALYDCLYTGMGYVRRSWNSKRRSVAHPKGQPCIDYVPAAKVYIDDTTHMPDKSDMGFIFHVEKRNYKTLSAQYPRYASDFFNRKDNQDQIEEITMQFKVTQDVESVFLTDNAQDPPKRWLLPLADFDPAMNIEAVDVGTPFDCETTFWYEVKFFKDMEFILQEPTFVGNESNYHIMSYSPQSNSAYSLGICYYMMDMQDINIFLLTSLVHQTFKYQKNEKEIVNKALLNQKEYLANHWKVGCLAVVDETWAKENPGRQAVTNKFVGEVPGGIPLLVEYLKGSMKDISGVTDTVEGTPTFSGMSGVAVAQLQGAGKVYHKEEQLKYMRFLVKIGYSMMFDIAENLMDTPHYIDFLGADNTESKVLVNDPVNSPLTYEPELMVVYCEVVENIELMKQIKRQAMIDLFDRGAIARFRLLESYDLDNPSRLHAEAMEEQGLDQIFRFLKQNPELMQEIQGMMQGMEAQAG